MTTCLGKSCSFGLPRVPFVNCCQFMYFVIFLLVLMAGGGAWLYQFLITAYLFTFNYLIYLFILHSQSNPLDELFNDIFSKQYMQYRHHFHALTTTYIVSRITISLRVIRLPVSISVKSKHNIWNLSGFFIIIISSLQRNIES